MAKPIVRYFFRAAVALLWVLCFIAALEATALWLQLRMERSNPLIVAYRAGETPKEPDAPPLLIDVPAIQPSLVGGWESQPTPFVMDDWTEQVLEWGVPTVLTGRESREIAWSAFPDLSPLAREVYARLRKEIAMVLDERGRIAAVYGVDKTFFGGIQGVLTRIALLRSTVPAAVYKAFEKVLRTGQPEAFVLSWPNEAETAALLSAACFPAPGGRDDGECVYLFVSVHPDSVQTPPSSALPETSRWIAPHFRFKANFVGDDYPGFKTNSLGFRDDDVALPKPDGVFRILCIGGSTTQEGASNAATYPKLLEAQLARAFPERVIEVVNAGIPGIASPGHLLRFPDYLALEPDLTVIHLGANDILLHYNKWLVNLPSRASRFLRWFSPGLSAPSRKTFARLHEDCLGFNLRLLAHLFQREGIAAAFASMAGPDPKRIGREERRFYDYQGKYSWDFSAFSLIDYTAYRQISNDLLRRLAVELDAPYIPVAERMTGGAELFTDFCHMTQAGIKAKAQVIFEGLHPVIEKRLGKPRD